MDIIDIERKAAQEAEEDMIIFNPLDIPVTVLYGGNLYEIPPQENKSFKTPIARHFGDYLVNLYVNTKDKNYDREKAVKLVFPS